MGNFSWRPLVKQVKPASGIPPSFIAAATIGEEGQPIGEVGLIAIVAKVTLSAPSSVLAKMKRDDGVGSSGRKKETAPMSPHALRQAAELTPNTSRPSIMQDVSLASLIVEAPIVDASTPAPSPPFEGFVQEATHTIVEVSVLTTLAGSILFLRIWACN